MNLRSVAIPLHLEREGLAADLAQTAEEALRCATGGDYRCVVSGPDGAMMTALEWINALRLTRFLDIPDS